jgi:hypothetical protein
MWPDPKWLEYIKPGSDIALALSLACGLGLLGEHWKWFPHLTAVDTPILWFGLIIFGSFTAVGLLGIAIAFLDLLVAWLKSRRC